MKKGAAKMLQGRTVLVLALIFLVFAIFANMFVFDFSRTEKAIEKFSDCAMSGMCTM